MERRAARQGRAHLLRLRHGGRPGVEAAEHRLGPLRRHAAAAGQSGGGPGVGGDGGVGRGRLRAGRAGRQGRAGRRDRRGHRRGRDGGVVAERIRRASCRYVDRRRVCCRAPIAAWCRGAGRRPWERCGRWRPARRWCGAELRADSLLPWRARSGPDWTARRAPNFLCLGERNSVYSYARRTTRYSSQEIRQMRNRFTGAIVAMAAGGGECRWRSFRSPARPAARRQRRRRPAGQGRGAAAPRGSGRARPRRGRSSGADRGQAQPQRYLAGDRHGALEPRGSLGVGHADLAARRAVRRARGAERRSRAARFRTCRRR